jgi:RNA polymerase sigma-70 factor, ECF subfamily
MPDVRLQRPGARSTDKAEAFEELFRMSYGRLARLLFRITRDFARAEEMASEALWRLYRKPPTHDTNLEGWLYRTGLRLALDYLRNERRRARYEALAGAVRLAPGPDESLEQGEERERVRGVLGKLKREQAGLILLRAEGFGYAEIGAVLNLKTASVGTLLVRAEEAFRKEYIHRYGKPGS